MTNIQDNEKQVVDLDYLHDLAKGNTKFVQEMIDTFVLENPKEIAAIGKAISNKDFEQIRQTAHFLLSSIPFVGLDKVIESEVCAIENTAADRAALKTNTTFHPGEAADEISVNDESALQKIKLLFATVKETCSKAHKELTNTDHQPNSPEK